MKISAMRKVFASAFAILFSTVSICKDVSATWTVMNNIPEANDRSYSSQTSSKPQAYKAGSTKIYYDTIAHALNNASSGDIIVANPPTKANYNNSSNTASVDTAVYTINEPIEIKSGVTFIVPTDSITVSSVTDAATLNTYIKSLWADDRKHGTAGSYANSEASKYLRTTINVANNCKITNKGTLVISGYLSSGATTNSSLIGHTAFSYSKIVLGSNSKIIQDNSNAITHCYGYIEEESQNNSSYADFSLGKVYLPLSVKDYRGFSVASGMEDANKYQGVPPFNQIEFRNISAKAYFRRNSSLYACTNVYIYQTGVPIFNTIDEIVSNNDTLVLSSSGSPLILFKESYSYLEAKFNTSTSKMDLNFVGDFQLNTFSFKIKISGVSKTLSTSYGYFPVSNLFNITLSKNTSQSGRASFDATRQSIKLLPGTQLVVSDGVDLSGKQFSIYSALVDGANGQSATSTWSCGVAYPTLNNAVCKVTGSGAISMKSIGGNVYCDTSSAIKYSENNYAESYEPWNQSTVSAPFVIKDFLKIREQLSVVPVSYATSKKVLIAMNTFYNEDNHPNPYLPSLNLVSEENSYNFNGFQGVVHLASISQVQLEFLANISNARKLLLKSGSFACTRYEYHEKVSNDNTVIFCALNSNVAIGKDDFDLKGITIESLTTKLDDGRDPLYVGKDIYLKANLDDGEKCYNKDVVWSSENSSIATVDESTGKVTGISLGAVKIYATSTYHEDIVGVYETEVISDAALVGVEEVWITSSTNRTSKTTVGNTSSMDKPGGYSVSYPWYYNEKQTSTNATTTYYLNFAPANAQISIVKWVFYSATTDREYMMDSSGAAVARQTPIDDDGSKSTRVHFNGRTNTTPDGCVVRCIVTDINNEEMTVDFKILHDSGTGCVTGDTMIRLADNSLARADSLKIGDLLKTWSFEQGDWVIEPIIFYECSPDVETDVITLELENGKSIDITWKQGFFDADIMDYFIVDNNNYEDVVGRNVLSFDGDTPEKSRIINVSLSTEVTTTCEIHTGHGFQFIANDILSVEPLINEHTWFKVNDDLKYDEELMQKDIETYGLLPYEVFEDYVTYEQYDLFNGKYLSVPIGKGYFTFEELVEIMEAFLPGNT